MVSSKNRPKPTNDGSRALPKPNPPITKEATPSDLKRFVRKALPRR